MGSEPPADRAGSDPPWADGEIPVEPVHPQIATVNPQPRSPPFSARRKRHPLLWIAAAVAAVLFLAAIYELATLPEARALANENPESTALMRARAEEALQQGKLIKRQQFWIPLSTIPRHAADAVIVSEDASFYRHHGIDGDELREALTQVLEKHSLGRGASTITMQLAKNLWLTPKRNLPRKAKEMLLAKRLEHALTKKRILELYLNLVEWGDGIYGIEAASRAHFGISAAQLSIGQGAILAAMLPAPRRWTPAQRPRVLRGRSLRLVDRLAEIGKISGEEASAAREEITALLGPAKKPEAEPEDELPDDEG